MAVVIKPKRGTNTPDTSDIVSGEIAIDTSAAKLYINDSGTVKEIGGGGSASGATTDVTQSSHGLSVKDCIRHNGSAWVKAQADSASTLALGVVTAVADSNTFTVAQSGRFELSSHGLTVGQWYYLSADTAGGLVTSEPTFSQPLVYVESANHVFVYPYRPTNVMVSGQTPLGIFVDEFTGNGSTAAYTLSGAPDSENNTQVFVNGVYQEKATYSLSGTTLTFDDNIANGSSIEVVRYAATSFVIGVPDDTSVTTAKLASTAVTTAKIADDAITSAKIADDAITSALIADDAVVTASIADDAITSALIADDAITSALIADDAITSALIADDAVIQAAIADEAVDEARLQISNAGSNGQFLSKQSGNTGGLTWAAAGIDGWSSSSNNLLPASASSGIYLGVNSATAANLLDDYEEGTWTPQYTSSGGDYSSVSYNSQDADYIKIGNVVVCQCYISASGSNHSGASGSLRVKGLPFTSTNFNNGGGVIIQYSKYFAGGQSDGPGYGSVNDNATYCTFYEKNGNFDGYGYAGIQTSGSQYLVFSAVYMTV